MRKNKLELKHNRNKLKIEQSENRIRLNTCLIFFQFSGLVGYPDFHPNPNPTKPDFSGTVPKPEPKIPDFFWYRTQTRTRKTRFFRVPSSAWWNPIQINSKIWIMNNLIIEIKQRLTIMNIWINQIVNCNLDLFK